jgi:SAM domain (Sterile alpha motif)
MQDLAKWLEELGMAEYTQRFAENDVDLSVLPHLSDSDLKELDTRCDRGESAGQPPREKPGCE